MRVFINGFGRIGRSVLRAAASAGAAGALAPNLAAQVTARWADLEIIGINDIASAEMCAYLFEYDSVFGPWRGTVALQSTPQGRALLVNGRAIPIWQTPDITTLDLRGVDVVMECTGRAGTRDVAARGLAAGARRVLISGPSDAADATVVLGANDHTLRGQDIVSNASCTTNALAPLARLIHDHWGVVAGTMTTIHCYTGSQPTIDAPGADFSRSRAAALSMVPTTTSAQRLLDVVLPHIAGRIIGSAVRVPTASVSAVDLAVLLARPANAADVNAVLQDESGGGGIIGATDRALVSSDLRARSESIIMALPETRVLPTPQGALLRVFGWYDNEWGFSNRMLDMALRMGVAAPH
jgi:glyceraldehyde 3-phosphate dehydrogenase